MDTVRSFRYGFGMMRQTGWMGRVRQGALASCAALAALTVSGAAWGAPSPEPASDPAAPSTSASQPAFQLAGGVLYHLKNGQRVAVSLPGVPNALQLSGRRAYVALGEEGAVVVGVDASGAAAIEKHVPVSHGTVTGFMLQQGEVWMQISATSAIRLGEAGPDAVMTPPAAVPTALTAPEPPVAAQAGENRAAAEPVSLPEIHVTKIYDGKVLLDRGKAQGLAVGDRFKIVRSERSADEAGDFEAEREVAVVVVESLSANTARARIWRGDRVAMGDRVEAADKHTDPSLMYPRHLTRFLEAEVHLRPILNVGDTGFGILLDANSTYYAEQFYLGLRSQPLGLGRSQGSTMFTQTTLAEGGYNSRPFAIGLGFGFTSVYGDLQELFQLTAFDSAASSERGADEWQAGQPETTPWSQEMQHAFALGQRVRLGAMDGLNLMVANTLLYFDGTAGRAADDESSSPGFIWGGTSAKLTLPLALNADLFLEGGGGVVGYAYGAVGVFGWLKGNGGPGSLGLMASAGGAGVWSARTRENLRFNFTEEDQIGIGGPMVSIGLRYRMGGDH